MNAQRRRFLFLSVAGGAAAAASIAVRAATTAQPKRAVQHGGESRGYQLTAHVQRFYRSAGRL